LYGITIPKDMKEGEKMVNNIKNKKSKVRIETMGKGPYIVKGNVNLIDT
jgi:hypothetical protein